MLDHVLCQVPLSKFDEIVAWYSTALATIGYSKQMEFPGKAVGFGTSKGEVPFWIASKEDTNGGGFHVAFRAKDHDTVDKFHSEALKAGGTCNGKPGLREHYHPNYYGTFVLDPVGNNIEVVDHSPH
ncbi:Glyoxalase/Bleomycin resistance protein/Dihydroxybiphenyl dioxygenase [Lindgomyces ingoldianus]|uniref:Glyoxalase/Bleomycin resistance protein/Dihydroxybiphenyl dioxygenase n=1 Tax=Lindgomyces ingoldianus TaxID=673940 RepID=A0ACB6QK55_9PLEO|nr:Glyoxalase/Bleomycin resistance protein/Dihydroxybiphenyl dioxygenase [Lindgomyces ingoldianus]KAF2467311.1 Glyoxalase/Bleomycin resistance protein/Dihydroxybiphenyl dioxygenase [Lindgomyces ingoldianus]